MRRIVSPRSPHRHYAAELGSLALMLVGCGSDSGTVELFDTRRTGRSRSNGRADT